MDRRSFLRGAAASGLIAAPAIVTFGNLMPVRGIIMPIDGMYGRSPGMDALDGLPSLRELEAMKAKWLAQRGEVSELLQPRRQLAEYALEQVKIDILRQST
jgi:hypothetical protein